MSLILNSAVDTLFFNCAAVELLLSIVLKLRYLRMLRMLILEAIPSLPAVHPSGETDMCGFPSER
jgi:hypothetical protein